MVFVKAALYMAPTLFSLNASVASERWPEKLRGVMMLVCWLADWLFLRRSIRNTRETLLRKGKFAMMLYCWLVQGLLRVLPSGSILGWQVLSGCLTASQRQNLRG